MRRIALLSICAWALFSCSLRTAPESGEIPETNTTVEKPVIAPQEKTAATPSAAAREEMPTPDLALESIGPRLMYLHRSASYLIKFENRGSGAALNVEVVATIPEELEYIAADPRGKLKMGTGCSLATMTWNFAEIPAQSQKEIKLELRAKKRGQMVLSARLFSATDRPPEIRPLIAEICTKVIGVSAMHISSYDTEDPCEVGKENIYVIEMRNEGTSPATNVIMRDMIPPEMEFLDAEGPVDHRWDNGEVVFEAYPILQPGDKLTYRIRCRAIKPAPSKNRAVLRYDQFEQEIMDEEGTSLYGEAIVPESPGRPAPVVTIRTKFPETALWEPLLVTRDQRCKLDLTIPDAITVQSLSVMASDRNGNVQLEKRTIEVRQDVFVQSSFPATATLGDELVAGALVKNSSGSEQTFAVTLHSRDFRVLSAEKVMVTVPHGEGQPVHWRIRPVSCGANKFSITAANERYLDQEQRTLFVRPVGEPRVETQKGTVAANSPWFARFDITPESTYSTAFVKVTFPNSFPALQGVEAMTRYPHG